MGIPAYLNQTEKITVTFYGWPLDGEQDPEDPTSLEIRIYDTSTDPDTLLTTDSAVPDGPVGKYYYEWTPTVEGDFNVQFFATFSDSSTNPVDNFFTVYEASEAPGIGTTLLSDQTILYTGEIDPLYLDPEEIKFIFPDANSVEIAELINQYSLEVKKIEKLKDDEDPSLVGLEYIYAATNCSLSRMYDDISTGSESSFKLGDLEVRRGSSSSGKGVSRGTATSWCELAAALRNELMANNAGMKRLSKGRGAGDNPNLIPSRTLRRYDHAAPIYNNNDPSNPLINQF